MVCGNNRVLSAPSHKFPFKRLGGRGRLLRVRVSSSTPWGVWGRRRIHQADWMLEALLSRVSESPRGKWCRTGTIQAHPLAGKHYQIRDWRTFFHLSLKVGLYKPSQMGPSQSTFIKEGTRSLIRAISILSIPLQIDDSKHRYGCP